MDRVLAVGDVHGDADALRACLRLGELTDSAGNWVGGKSVLVQCGDVLDRGKEDLECLLILDELRRKARESGGYVYTLLGNHELLNVRGEMSMVVNQGFHDFDRRLRPHQDALMQGDWSSVRRWPDHKQCRVAAMAPGGVGARLLADYHVAVCIGQTVFCHAGLTPDHLSSKSIEEYNREVRAWLLGEGEPPEGLEGRSSPVWTREYSHPPGAELFTDANNRLRHVLEQLGMVRMVVGHTIQPLGINGAAGGAIWRIDTGMSTALGGGISHAEVLEIGAGGNLRIITQSGCIDIDERLPSSSSMTVGRRLPQRTGISDEDMDDIMVDLSLGSTKKKKKGKKWVER